LFSFEGISDPSISICVTLFPLLSVVINSRFFVMIPKPFGLKIFIVVCMIISFEFISSMSIVMAVSGVSIS